MNYTLHLGDCLDVLPTLPECSVQCVCTSPPYFGLRSYLDAADDDKGREMGTESTPAEYVAKMVGVFRGLRRVLRDDGCIWLNLGDSTTNKQLQGIPWKVAFALQDDGWYLRSDIIWHKPNPMPESVKDRPTRSHEYVFLLTKNARYYFDSDAIAEAMIGLPHAPGNNKLDASRNDFDSMQKVWGANGTRNSRSVWTIPTQPRPEAHFAAFPDELARRCILAGSAPGDTVLDPFAGRGTTLSMAINNGRSAIGIELNPEYAKLIRQTVNRTQVPLLLETA
jgi:DNA modification methylase